MEGKNVLASIWLLSSLVLAVTSSPLRVSVSVGILIVLPSEASAEMYLCAVQMSRSSAFSSQSLLCPLLIFGAHTTYLLLVSLVLRSITTYVYYQPAFPPYRTSLGLSRYCDELCSPLSCDRGIPHMIRQTARVVT